MIAPSAVLKLIFYLIAERTHEKTLIRPGQEAQNEG
jgi:hypothetical protein